MIFICVYVSCSVIRHSVHFGKRNLSCSSGWKNQFSRNEKIYREFKVSIEYFFRKMMPQRSQEVSYLQSLEQVIYYCSTQ